RLRIDEWVDDIVQGLVHDAPDLGYVPARAQCRDLCAHPLGAVLVRAGQREDQLCVGALQRGTSADQAVAQHRLAEGERAGRGDDRLVEVEEGRDARLRTRRSTAG